MVVDCVTSALVVRVLCLKRIKTIHNTLSMVIVNLVNMQWSQAQKPLYVYSEDNRLPGVMSRVPVVQASSWPTHCVPLQTRYHVCSVSLHLTAKLLPSRCSHVEPYGATSAQPRAAHKQTCLMYISVSTHTHRFLYSRT